MQQLSAFQADVSCAQPGALGIVIDLEIWSWIFSEKSCWSPGPRKAWELV